MALHDKPTQAEMNAVIFDGFLTALETIYKAMETIQKSSDSMRFLVLEAAKAGPVDYQNLDIVETKLAEAKQRELELLKDVENFINPVREIIKGG